jgi:acetyltransferase-like isoleucine patch superfamily enzyme
MSYSKPNITTDFEGIYDVHYTTELGKNTNINAHDVIIGRDCVIGNNVTIKVTGKFELGDFSRIGDNVIITCTEFVADSWLYMTDRVEVGRGGCYGPNSKVKIGKHVGIFEGTILNPSEAITIGDDVGIGAEVMIWTHGAWLDVTQGFPSDFGPVTIGNDVWLPARCIVLPNVTIGNDVVIGINSTVNRNIPSGAFAAGSPCKVLKEDVYPNEITDPAMEILLRGIISDWVSLVRHKGISGGQIQIIASNTIELIYQGNSTLYSIRSKEMKGDSNDLSEDLRDYLRRRGIKIYTDKPFRSI